MPLERSLLTGIALLGVLALVFAPTAIAMASRHPERRRIARLNPLALLSFLLWLALMAWAIGGQRDDSRIARLVGNERHRRTLKMAVAILVAAGVASTAYALAHR